MEPTAGTGFPSSMFLQRINWIYSALCFVMLCFLGFAFWYRPHPVYVFPTGPDIFLYTVPVLVILGYFFGGYAFRILLEPLQPKDPPTRLEMRYQSASLIRYGCLEVPALLSLYAYMKQAYFFYLFIGILLILYQLSIWPTRKRIEGQVPGLSKPERL